MGGRAGKRADEMMDGPTDGLTTDLPDTPTHLTLANGLVAGERIDRPTDGLMDDLTDTSPSHSCG